MTGVVLRDRFFVEERYIGGWRCEDSPVLSLHADGMLVPFPEPEQVRPLRSALYKTLFHTLSLQRAHKKNIPCHESDCTRSSISLNLVRVTSKKGLCGASFRASIVAGFSRRGTRVWVLQPMRTPKGALSPKFWRGNARNY